LKKRKVPMSVAVVIVAGKQIADPISRGISDLNRNKTPIHPHKNTDRENEQKQTKPHPSEIVKDLSAL
jgi:hypothetical protein